MIHGYADEKPHLCVHLPLVSGNVTMNLSVVQAQEALSHVADQSAELTAVREALVDKETAIDQLKEQVETLLQEVTSLNEAYACLQVMSLIMSGISLTYFGFLDAYIR